MNIINKSKTHLKQNKRKKQSLNQYIYNKPTLKEMNRNFYYVFKEKQG